MAVRKPNCGGSAIASCQDSNSLFWMWIRAFGKFGDRAHVIEMRVA